MKTREVDFSILEGGKALVRDTLSLIMKHDRWGLFVTANIVVYFIAMTLLVLRLFGLI